MPGLRLSHIPAKQNICAPGGHVDVFPLWPGLVAWGQASKMPGIMLTYTTGLKQGTSSSHTKT